MECVDGGGILALFGVLTDHFGAVERDLVAAGLHFADLGTAKLSLGELASFVHYAPPGTAVFFMRNEGFSPETHFLAQIFDTTLMSLYLNTEDAQQPPELREFQPKPTPRPGVVYADADAGKPDGRMTVDQYAQIVGIQMNWEG